MSTTEPSDGSERGVDLLVVGHTNVDHFLHVPHLPSRDRTVPISRQEQRLGGTAANIARVAAGYGVRVGLVSRVGADFPAPFLRQLRDEHLDLSCFEVVSGAFSPCAYIVEDGRGGQVTLMDQGPMGDERNAPLPTSLLEPTGWVHLTTGDPRFQLKVARAARSRGSRLAADPAQEIHYRWTGPALKELLTASELLFGNRAEIQQALKLLRLRRPSALLDLVPLVVVTTGSAGAFALTRHGRVEVPAVPAAGAGRVTGAGDAFRGGFYSAWFVGEPLRACLVAGTRAAAAWLRAGGEPPHFIAKNRSKAGREVGSPTR